MKVKLCNVGSIIWKLISVILCLGAWLCYNQTLSLSIPSDSSRKTNLHSLITVTVWIYLICLDSYLVSVSWLYSDYGGWLFSPLKHYSLNEPYIRLFNLSLWNPQEIWVKLGYSTFWGDGLYMTIKKQQGLQIMNFIS